MTRGAPRQNHQDPTATCYCKFWTRSERPTFFLTGRGVKHTIVARSPFWSSARKDWP